MNRSSQTLSDSLSEFLDKYVRVITSNNHYRGLCEKIDGKHMNVLLKNVVKKREEGWLNVSDLMLIRGGFIESIYIEKNYPFDEDESLILSVEEGEIVHNSEQIEE